MHRVERLIAILQALRGRRMPVTANDLAKRFGVTVRTIYRDVATLVGLGAVVEGAAGVGYVLRDDHFLPPTAFDGEEAAAIMLGLRFVERRGDAALAEAARSARGKLAATSPILFGEEAAWSSPLVVGPPPTEEGFISAAVRKALSGDRKLRLDYVDANGRTSQRVVWPVVLGFFDGAEVLAAWCERRNAFRHFRLDRIRAVVTLDVKPPKPRRRLLADYRAIEPGVAL